MRRLRLGWYWSLDYWYVGRQQLRAFFSSRVPASFADGSKSPVLLLAGVYEPWHFLRPIALRLNAAGHPVHVARDIGHNRAPIADAAAIAQRYLDQHDLRGVVLLAHSKGGLVGKRLMAVEDISGRVASMVAIATPFGGSSLARFVPVRTIRALGPADESITTLAANLAVNSRVTSVFGEFDPHIPSGSRLDGAVNIELPIVGHFRLLGDERVIRAVEAAVEGTDRR